MTTHGVEAVQDLIEESEVTYPVSTRRLLREHALANVEIDGKGNSMMLGEVLGPTDIREFSSEADLEQKLEPVFERHRAERRRSVFDRLKRIFR